jgi:hypothetical protein
MKLPVRYEFIDRKDEKFFEHLEFISAYEGRNKHNYDLSSLIHKAKNENRFNVGALKIIINNELSRSLLLEEYKNWMLLARLISYNNPKLPLLTVYGNDILMDIANKNNFDGIFASVDERNKFYINCIDTEKNTLFNNTKYPLYESHLKVIKQIKKLDKPQLFNYQLQYILYREIKGNINQLFPSTI